MPDYRVYLLSQDGHVFNRIDLLDCDDDDAALDKAKQLVDGYDLELWHLDRKIAAFAKRQLLKRQRTRHKTTFDERLANHAKKARDDLALMPEGEARDSLIEKIRQIEVAMRMNQALAKRE